MAGDQQLIDLYVSCIQEVLMRGWADEVRENRERPTINTVDRAKFLHECAYCVFVANFAEKTIRERWPALTRAFRSWDCEEISKHKEEVRDEAMQVFGNEQKVTATLKCAERLSGNKWEEFKDTLIHRDLSEQLEFLDNELPGIGKAAKYQLAGAIGIDVAKPDVHLLRLAQQYGHLATEEGVQQFANRIAKLVGERVKVVDYVLWRYSEGSSNTV